MIQHGQKNWNNDGRPELIIVENFVEILTEQQHQGKRSLHPKNENRTQNMMSFFETFVKKDVCPKIASEYVEHIRSEINEVIQTMAGTKSLGSYFQDEKFFDW